MYGLAFQRQITVSAMQALVSFFKCGLLWVVLAISAVSVVFEINTHTRTHLIVYPSTYRDIYLYTQNMHICMCMFVQVPVYTHFYTVCMNRIITIYSSGLSYILSHPIPFPFFASPKQTLYLPLKTCSLCARSLPLPSITLFSQRKNYSIPSDTS